MIKVLLFLLFASGLTAFASPVKVTPSRVTYASGKDTVSGYCCVPQGKGPFPALIVIHEWWGLNDWVKQQARELASQGYVTLAIDLYRGRGTADPGEAHELMRGLPEDRANRDVAAAAAYLKSRPDVIAGKIGSIGWCMGGGYSLATALDVPDLAACVICYGRLVTDSAAIARIPCPILGIFGGEDKGITPQDVHDFETACTSAGKSIDVHIYKGAGHAFMNPNNKDGYRKQATEDAAARIRTFLRTMLKSS